MIVSLGKPTAFKSAIDAFLYDISIPATNVPHEGRTVKLVEEGVKGLQYNLIRYLDRYWALHWAEASFDIERILGGNSTFPVLVAPSIEEVYLALDITSKRHQEVGKDYFCDPAFTKIRDNFYLVDFSSSPSQSTEIMRTPTFLNSQIARTDLFQSGSGEEIIIISPAPSRACNFRCAYCYHHDHGFNKNTEATQQWSKAIITAADKIKRPIRFSAGAMGEPFFDPIWKETALKLVERDNVVSLAAASNLSMDIESFFDKADPAKVGIMASLHPSEFKNHDDDFEAFLRRLKTLRNIGVSLVVNYVLTPDQVHSYPMYRSRISDLEIPMTSNVLRGPFRGKVYPEAFTEDEMAIVKLCYDENSYIFDSQSHYRNPYGLECISGRVGFYLEYDGALYNCHFARQKIGSVYDEKLMARTQNGYCTATKCESQTTIGWQADIARQFEVQRTMHHYVRKG